MRVDFSRPAFLEERLDRCTCELFVDDPLGSERIYSGLTADMAKIVNTRRWVDAGVVECRGLALMALVRDDPCEKLCELGRAYGQPTKNCERVANAALYCGAIRTAS